MVLMKFVCMLGFSVMLLSSLSGRPFIDAVVIIIPGLLFALSSGFYFWELTDPEDYNKKFKKIFRVKMGMVFMAFATLLFAVVYGGLASGH